MTTTIVHRLTDEMLAELERDADGEYAVVDCAKLRALLSERAALKADADRYRWLRDNGDSGDHDIVVARMYQVEGSPELRCEVADYDQAIDAAMKEQPK